LVGEKNNKVSLNVFHDELRAFKGTRSPKWTSGEIILPTWGKKRNAINFEVLTVEEIRHKLFALGT